jgi:hypothetical protein
MSYRQALSVKPTPPLFSHTPTHGTRYMTSFDDVVEDMPIARKLEVYQGLLQQVSTRAPPPPIDSAPSSPPPSLLLTSPTSSHFIGLAVDPAGGPDRKVARFLGRGGSQPS